MLQHPTIDRLRELGLEGMAKSLRELSANPESKALDHMEWLGILLEHEMTLRQQKRFEARARTAKLRHLASVEDIDYRAARGLDRTLFLKLAGCDWIREHRHCLMTGPCGVGKSWLACALGYKACRENLSVLYQRVPRLFALLALGRGDGRYAKLIRQLGRVDLLILDLCAARSDVEVVITFALQQRLAGFPLNITAQVACFPHPPKGGNHAQAFIPEDPRALCSIRQRRVAGGFCRLAHVGRVRPARHTRSRSTVKSSPRPIDFGDACARGRDFGQPFVASICLGVGAATVSGHPAHL